MSDLNNKITIIKQARDDMQDALIEQGQMVGKDIRDYAEAISNIEGGTSSNIKLFSTISEMEADASSDEGTYGTVYGREEAPINADTEFQQVRFPATVTLSSEVTSGLQARFRATGEGWIDMNAYVTPTSAEIMAYGDSGELSVEYTSSDGIHYTREGDTETYDLGTAVIYEEWGSPFDNRIGQFILSSAPAYNGLYQYLNYNDNARIHLVPMSSITKSGSGSSTTFSWDGTFTEQIFRADKLKELARTLHRTEYSTSSSYNIHFALDENNNLIAFEMFGNVEKTSSSADIEANYAYFTDTSSYGVRAATSRVVMDVYDIDTTTEEYSYTYRTTLTATQLGNVCSKFNLVLNTLPIMEKSSYYTMEDYPYLFRDNIYWVYPSSSSYRVSSKSFSISNGTGLHTEYLKWQICPTQFTLSQSGNLYDGEIALGKEGVVTGNMGDNISHMFNDAVANIYVKAQDVYDTMTPLVATASDKMAGLGPDIVVIPSKRDGTPLLDTSNLATMQHMFYDCSNLKEVAQLDTRATTTMESMFSECSSLVRVPLLDTSGVTNMNSMFYNCRSLLTVPLMDTSNVTNMTFMFSGCNSLTSIPLFNTTNVTSMLGMFANCAVLTSIPQLDTSSVTDVSNMFNYCYELANVPVFNTSSISNMSSMFYSCNSLTDESLNNIMQMCINAVNVTSTKTLKNLELTQEQATRCQSLSNYQAFINAGWTTGY